MKTGFNTRVGCVWISGRLLDGLDDIKNVLALKVTQPTDHPDEMNTQIETVAKASTRKWRRRRRPKWAVFLPRIMSVFTYGYGFCCVRAELSIAGTSTDFVNRILEKVKSGIPNGGLEEI